MKKARLVLILVMMVALAAGIAACGGAEPTSTTVREQAAALPENTWTELESSGDTPSARYGHAMAYDSLRDQVILFGGSEGMPGLDDTWAYDRVTGVWTELKPEGALPPERAAHALLYDAKRDQVLLFGGGNAAGGLGDLWAYSPSANTWKELRPEGAAPSARGSSLVYDSERDQVLLFGGSTKAAGIDGAITNHRDMWAYDPAANTWNELEPSGRAPTARAGHAMVYDPISKRVILFGGFDGDGLLNDTWAYDPAANTWTELEPEGEVPGPRGIHSMVYDSGRGKAVLFGGIALDRIFGDTWAFDPATDSWTLLDPRGDTPVPRANSALVYDQAAGEVILFGGGTTEGGASSLTTWDDIWAYRLPDDLEAAAAADAPQWVTFEGESVSLSLPDTFVGGDPRDPEVLAALSEAEGSSASPDVEAYDLLMSELSDARGMPAGVQVFKPVVGVMPEMPDLLDQFMHSMEGSETQMRLLESSVLEVTDEQAHIMARFSIDGLPGEMLQYLVLLRGDSYVCVVIYTFGDASDGSLADTFKRSAETIVVKERTHQ